MDFLLAGCSEAFISNKNIYLSLFLGGLFGSLNHCASMCGPFIIAQTAHRHSSNNILMRMSGSCLIAYHMGRMMTYILLGVMTSFVLFPFLNMAFGHMIISILLGGAGLLFLLHGLSIHTHFKLPFSDIFAHISSQFSSSTSYVQKFTLGAILGFLPCGLVLAAILAVTSLASPIEAMFGMMIFTAGTLPMLIGIGLISNGLMQKYKPLYTKFTKAMMIINGFVLITLSLEKII